VVHPNGLQADGIFISRGKEVPIQADLVNFDQYHDVAVLRTRDFKCNGNVKDISYQNAM
jgi:hypothetical protein